MEIDTDFKALASGDSSAVAKWKRAFFVAVVIIIGLAIGWGVHAGTLADDDDDGSIPTPSPAASLLDAKEVERIRSMVNFSVDPCEDFYEFACGGWLKNESWRLPDDPDEKFNYYALLSPIAKKIQTEQYELIKQNLPLVSAYYDACMDVDAINAAGTTPFINEINKIFAQTQVSDLVKLVGTYHKEGLATTAFFKLHIDSDNHHADVYRMYLIPPLELSEVVSVAENNLTTGYYRLLSALNHPDWSDDDLWRMAADAYAIDLDVANAYVLILDAFSSYDVRINQTIAVTPSELDELLGKDFGFSEYVESVALTPNPTTDIIHVWALPFFQAVANYTLAQPLSKIQAYLAVHLIYDVTAYLPTKASAAAQQISLMFQQEPTQKPTLDIFGEKISKKKSPFHLAADSSSRANTCLEETLKPFSTLISHAWILAHWSKKFQEAATELTVYIDEAFGELIREAEWLDEETRQQALTKWRLIAKNVGYDNHWIDFEGLSLSRGAAFENYRKTMAWINTKYRGSFYGKPINRAQFRAIDYFTPDLLDTNAFYVTRANSINLLPGMMREPLFSPDRPMLLNLGGYGFVIGHEFTHGFDNKGRLYNGTGAYVSWWTDASDQAFNQRAECLRKQYDEFPVYDTHVKGNKTLGENIADHGGIAVAWKAYQRHAKEAQQLMQGFTNDQLFFLVFAQGWCNLRSRASAIDQVNTDEHSPSRYRINGVVSNTPEFAQAYKCPASSPMGRSLTEARCKVW